MDDSEQVYKILGKKGSKDGTNHLYQKKSTMKNRERNLSNPYKSLDPTANTTAHDGNLRS